MRLDQGKRTQYMLELFGKETELHKKIRKHSEEKDVINMQISAYEGQLLQLLTQLHRSEKIVEIGCLYGYSALWMLEALPSTGKIYLLEVDGDRVQWMQENFQAHPQFHQMQWLVGDARESLKKLEDQGPFDLCFIDANKAAYTDYLDWAEQHVRKGGLILGDNSFLWGGVYEEGDHEKNAQQVKAMKAFNSRLSDSSRYLSSLIPTEEGLTVAQKLF